MRAGNTSMQSIVVPLAQEAKSKKILPRNLLSSGEKKLNFSIKGNEFYQTYQL